MDLMDGEASCFEQVAHHDASAPDVDQRARIAELMAQPAANLIALLTQPGANPH
jgi:hypothetical protein